MIVGAVCARAGSKGLPGKNLRPLDGKPLIEHAIDTALSSICEKIVVSTDIPEYATQPCVGSVHYLSRSAELATDTISKWPVYQHILAWAQHEWPKRPIDAVVDVDVSRPLVTARDVNACVSAWWANSYADTVMAVARGKKSPYFDIMEMDLDGRMYHAKEAVPHFTCRQDTPPAWYHAGVYVIGTDALRTDSSMWDGKVYGCEVDALATYDVDDETDWQIVEMLIKQKAAACR